MDQFSVELLRLSKPPIMMTPLSSEFPTLIVDLQGFQYKENEFTVKELAAVCCNTNHEAHYFFKPPKPFSSLTQGEQTQYRWLEKNYHGGVKWSDGYIQLSEFPMILQRLCKIAANNHRHRVSPQNVTILCKGRLKKDILLHHLRWNKIIDLDDCSPCLPSLKSLNTPRCMEHIQPNYSHCALANVHFLYKCIVDLNIKLQ